MAGCCIDPRNFRYSPSKTRAGAHDCHCAGCGKWLGMIDEVPDNKQQRTGDKRKVKK